MNFDQYKTAFEKAASDSGYTENNIKRCLDYAKILFRNNVPVIYNTSHLSALVGYNKSYIKSAVVHTSYFYRDFTVIKRNGKLRSISEPLPSLKEIQIWILENILVKVKISPFAKAYRKNVGLLENIRFHVGQPKVFTLDLNNFFTSIKLECIEKIFLELGYSRILSNLLAKLCTKDEVLPQGAPTSPALSNIFFKTADDLIAKYCVSHKIKYTRYADDMCFSGDFNEEELFDKVKICVTDIGLSINPSKTKIMLPDTRQTVTGIVVNRFPQVVFHKRNKLRQDIYYIKKFGLIEHMKHREIKQSNYLKHLIGKVNFILQVNPGDIEFQSYKSFLTKLLDESNSQ